MNRRYRQLHCSMNANFHQHPVPYRQYPPTSDYGGYNPTPNFGASNAYAYEKDNDDQVDHLSDKLGILKQVCFGSQ